MGTDTRSTRTLPPLDDLDRQIGHALQLDGRAAFSRIAEVLGVSDQTIARRWAKLRSSRSMRVLGLTEPSVVGETVWLIRVSTTPDAAVPLAESLARRTDTAWVGLLGGGTEVSAVSRSSADWARNGGEAVLLRELPRTPRVLSVRAYCQLHQFFGGAEGLVLKSGMLTPEQVAQLSPPAPTRPDEPVRLTADDHKLLACLAQDGRTPVPELAAATGWSPSTVRRRMAELRATGALYFDVDYGVHVFGLGTRAAVWLSVPPAQLHATGEAVAAHPEVAFAAATSGPANLFLAVVCRDPAALYAYVTGPLAQLPGVRDFETYPMVRSLKGPGPFLPGPH
ncbi:Lrp/AsnC family transcriptional regulator [Streptomyces oryzae]|uniref:Lrp/AsnC family transcriptional regulator n=1 Tax=Streptomyces oryzae TaxID=1434886 RepID=UPI0027DACAFA|nr:AsnC family transcriptional regulator [Streptomyces oryzae]